MTNEQLLDLARELNAGGAAYALVTVVRVLAPTSAYLGAQAIVLADGTLHGWIGDGCAKDVVITAAQGAIGSGEPKLVRISNDALHPEEDIERYEGVSYYFCCDGCRTTFQKDPRKYAAIHHASSGRVAA